MSNKNIKNESHSYGAISIIVLTISIVIGSGIFFKNDELFNTTHSTIVSMVAWIIVSGLVLTMLYSFIEISSSTSKTGEIGSLSTWASKFWNNKSARIVGYYFIFINLPINIALLSTYSTDTIFALLKDNGVFDALTEQTIFWIRTFATTIIALLFLSSIGVLNSVSNKSSKSVQQVGFVFKIVPMIFVIVVFLYALFSTSFSSSINPPIGGVFDITNTKNIGLQGNSSPTHILTLIMLSLPAVMFAFDGFIYSANLQSETKSKKSFSRGLISGMIIIIIFYLFVSYAIYNLGSPGEGFSLFSVIENAFPDKLYIPTIFSVMLIISIISGMSGLFTASIRSTASLSTDNLIKDQKLKLLKKNKHSVPKNAGMMFLGISIFWLLILRTLDTVSAIDQMFWNPVGFDNISYMGISGVSGNTAVIIAFIFYSFVIFGGVINRKSEKVETDKLKLFKTIGIIAVSGVMFIVFYSTINMFLKDYSTLSDYLSLGILLIIPIILVFAYIYNDRNLKHIDEEFILIKNSEIEKFYN